MAEEVEIRPIVARISLSLTRIRKLAAGVIRKDEKPPVTVLRADMQDALAIAQSVDQTIKAWGQRVVYLRTQGWGGLVSELLYGILQSGSEGVVRAISSHLENSAANEVVPVALPVLIAYDFRITGNQDLLAVLSGELSWNDSPLSEITRAFNSDVNAFTASAVDVIISALPVIGPIYDIATGVLGYRLPDAQKLTTTERVLRIALVGAGAILAVLIKGGRVTARTMMIMQAGSEMKMLQTSLGKLATFKALAVSVAKMTPEAATTIMDIVKLIRNGGLPTLEQMDALFSFFHGINQTATAAHWAVIAKTPANIVGNVNGVHILKYVAIKKGEPEAFAALVKNLPNAEIISLPELSPADYERVAQGLTRTGNYGLPRLTATPFVKHPDLAIEGALADIYAPERDTFDKIIATVVKKSAQAPTVVINLDQSAFLPQQVIDGLPRIWGDVYGMSLRRVIILDSKGFFKIITRPVNFRLGFEFAIPVQTLENLREIWAANDKEDAAAVKK